MSDVIVSLQKLRDEFEFELYDMEGETGNRYLGIRLDGSSSSPAIAAIEVTHDSMELYISGKIDAARLVELRVGDVCMVSDREDLQTPFRIDDFADLDDFEFDAI